MSDLNYMAEDDAERLFSPGDFDFDFDFDYEFDAPRVYDFSLPETELEAREAELWFDSAGSYPPSPFVVKLKQRLAIDVENEEISSGSDHEEDMNSPSDQGREAEEVGHNIFGIKSYLPKSSTLFKPTLSHLAKKVQSPNADSESIRRFHELLVKIDKKVMKPSPLSENQASKRQKLETGYLSKVAHLKHQALFLHKNQNNGSLGSGSSRSSQVTVPKGPELETARRAQRQRSKIEAESKKDGISAPYFFKALPLNRKILKSPSLSFPKRSALPTTEFQAFHLRTSERAKLKESNAKAIPNYVSASRNDTAKPRSLRSFATLKEDKNAVHSPHNKILVSNRKAEHNTQPGKISPDSTSREQRLQIEPPAELFSQMTLSAEDGSNVKTLSRVLSSKGTKENTPVQAESLGKAAGERYKYSTGRSNEARRRICSKSRLDIQ